MNLLTKIILAIDSILLIIVLVALVKGGIFTNSTGQTRTVERFVDPAPIYSTKLSPTIDRRSIHSFDNPNARSTNGLCPSVNSLDNCDSIFRPSIPQIASCELLPSINNQPVNVMGERYKDCSSQSSFYDLFLQLFPTRGILSRFIAFLWNIILGITVHDIIFLYIFTGIIYLLFNFYECIYYKSISKTDEFPSNDKSIHTPATMQNSSDQNGHSLFDRLDYDTDKKSDEYTKTENFNEDLDHTEDHVSTEKQNLDHNNDDGDHRQSHRSHNTHVRPVNSHRHKKRHHRVSNSIREN